LNVQVGAISAKLKDGFIHLIYLKFTRVKYLMEKIIIQLSKEWNSSSTDVHEVLQLIVKRVVDDVLDKTLMNDLEQTTHFHEIVLGYVADLTVGLALQCDVGANVENGRTSSHHLTRRNLTKDSLMLLVQNPSDYARPNTGKVDILVFGITLFYKDQLRNVEFKRNLVNQKVNYIQMASEQGNLTQYFSILMNKNFEIYTWRDTLEELLHLNLAL
jgi:hypothetical protein